VKTQLGPGGMPVQQKTVFLVRHAQSEQNIATARLKAGDPTALLTIAALGYDAPCSEAGATQLATARQKAERLVGSRCIALVAYSPLRRAVETARVLFGGTNVPMMEVPQMYERTLPEYFFPFLLERRVEAVREWICTRNEQVIALVGHGQFFKRALGNGATQNNVEIIECSFDPQSGFVQKQSVFDGFPEAASSST
jgi:phosphohistidine phosphatase SixA